MDTTTPTTTSLPDARALLAEVRARTDAATPGPWIAETAQDCDEDGWLNSESFTGVVLASPPPGADYDPESVSYGALGPDAAFVAHARTDVPWLLAEVARRDAALEAVLAVCDEPRPWDENEADHAEARSARAYNSALAKTRAAVTAALAAEAQR